MARRKPQADPERLALDLYAAVLDGRGVEASLGAIAGALQAETGFVTRIAFEAGVPTGAPHFAQRGFDTAALEDYAAYWVAEDPRMISGAGAPAGVVNFSRLIAPEALAGSRFWNEFATRRAPAFHSLSVKIDEPGDVTGILAVQRPRHAEPFGVAEEAMLTALLPHLRRAFLAESRLHADRLEAGAMRAGLDALRQGAAILAGHGGMVFANAALTAAAATRDGLLLGPRGPRAMEGAAQAQMERAVALALAVTAGRMRLLPDAAQFAVPRPSGAAPWQVQVLPLLPGAFAGFSGALVLVTDPARRAAPSEMLLRQVLGLTPAEASLAAALAAGRSLAEHARRRRVSVETLRTHLAHVRRKTGCRRQADLVALVLRLGG